ncbi:methyltransferase domain-containing protein [Sphingomonas arenae]|uniref:methyltransferase domain-containing protein n=1 Tax=Sphingomonas arenae TaxID=2812555 RepID=UPI00196785F1
MNDRPFLDLFSGHAELYAQARPTYPPSLMPEIAALAPGRTRAWDAGTGNGQSAHLLAGHFDHVHATDASEQQIAHAQPHPRVHFAVEPAERCSLASGSCDLVLVAQALHWFDLDAFYAEARRVLKPGGVLAAIGYGWFYVDPQVDEVVGRTLLKPLEPYWASNNWLLVDGYRTIPFPGEEVRCAPAAMHLAWSREQLVDYVRSWSAFRRWTDADPAAWNKVLVELTRVWPDEQVRHVFMPIVTRVARL